MATSTLERNLAALARTSPDAARAVLGASPRHDVRFLSTGQGVLSAEIGEGAEARALASRRRPLDEARVLVDSLDLSASAVFIVSGFGVGHHVEALARKLGKTGIVVVFEPDVGLLRAVLERVDCSSWLGSMNVAVVTDAEDPAVISGLVDGIEGLVAMGVSLVEHPASRARMGDAGRRFHQQFIDIVRAVRMTVVTTMVQVKTTLRNLTQNLDRYTQSPGIEELRGCCRGVPAIVVSAGPSLSRNIDLLRRPELRDRFAIIAVQTVLKPLLERGIRPQFVTALDYSEISRRFYEGLTAADLEGVTLVADPKVNPAVLEAWPRGACVRVQADRYLDQLLGKDLARPKGTLKPGATVAHLAYYLARHLGCDPVALIGQDLGFTDGQYYAAGAAIHNVWAGELNELNTLEMLEWQRIVRMGGNLRAATDVLGRPIYTDEQMATYLVQFERDFKEDARAGLTIIDATEGGVRKRHTETSSLAEFLDQYTDRASSPVRIPIPAGGKDAAAPAMRRVEERVEKARAAAWRVAELSRKTDLVLAEIAEHQQDQERVERLIRKTEQLGASVVTCEPAYALAHTLNQTGSFNRIRADRAIQMESQDGTITPMERQRRQVERDRENVSGLADAADTLAAMLDDALRTIRGGPRITRETAAPARGEHEADCPESCVRIAAIVPTPGDRTDLADELAGGRNVLETTLDRLAMCRGLGAGEGRGGDGSIVVLTDDVERVRSWVRTPPDGVRIEFVATGSSSRARREAVRSGRMLARECWRGGVANLSVYDEVIEPASLLATMSAASPPIDAALVVGPDWACVDPVLCDEVIARHRSNPKEIRFAFTQAAPGLCGCVIARSAVANLHAAGAVAGTFASVGGVLGYVPTSPTVDLINLPQCVGVEAALRDAGERYVADTKRGREAVRRLLAGERVESVRANDARHLVLRIARGWDRMSADAARREIEQLADRCEDGVVTFRGESVLAGDDPLSHPDLRRLCEHARRLGLGVHVRTPLTAGSGCAWLVECRSVDIISVDLLAQGEETYAAVTGRNDFVRVRERLDQLIALRAGLGDTPSGEADREVEDGAESLQHEASDPAWRTPWIVPRITRCDAVYAEIERFHREWLARCGWAVIDPLETTRPGERILALPLPTAARVRRERGVREVGC